jgi:UPF0288 family protein (methanogenesis marker protein 3)
MDMDTDHVVFRKFKRLHLYSLLFQQRKLAIIDEEIADMELEKGPKSTSKFERLTELLPKLDGKLKKYGVFVPSHLSSIPSSLTSSGVSLSNANAPSN